MKLGPHPARRISKTREQASVKGASIKCDACGKSTPGRYQRSTDYKWVCFDCLPRRDVDRYPGWRARMKKAAQ